MRTIQWLHFPLFIKWYITSLCNLRCSHCYLTDYTQQEDLEKIVQFVDYFGKRGVRTIVLLGGEPLVRKDLEIITERIISQKMQINIATNGILVSPQRAKSLVHAGATRFQVSIEGYTPELNDSVRGEGTFQKIIAGIRNLKTAGAHVTLATTIGKNNYHHMSGLHRLARELNIDILRLSAFAPVGTGLKNRSAFLLDREIVLHVKNELQLLLKAFPFLPIDSTFLKADDSKKNDSSCTLGCGAGTSTLILNSDFSVSACDLLVEEDRTKIKISKPEQIAELWQRDFLFHKWRGLELPANGPLKTFEEVHQHGCQVNYSSYGENLFR